jgi:ribosomal 50S subunit-recycling heat shock protein
MRLDKYLKVARIFKRRTVAHDVSEGERITVNGKTAKPSTSLKIGDVVQIRYGLRLLEIRVLSIEESSKKADASAMFEVLKDEKSASEPKES